MAQPQDEEQIKKYGALDTPRRKLTSFSADVAEKVARMREYGVDDLVEEVYGSRRVLLMYTGSATMVLFLTAAIYTKVIERWPWLTAFYFTAYAVTGVGYGDIGIETSNWRWIVLACIELFGSLCVGTLLSVSLATLILTEDEEDFRSTTATRRRFWKLSGLVFGILTISAIIVGLAEDWSWAETIYWAVDTVVTVGNGYRTPDTPVGRGLCVIVFIIASPSAYLLISAMIFYPRARLREIFRQRAFDAAKLASPTEDQNAFTVKLLLEARLVHPDDLHDVLLLYEHLKRQHLLQPATAGVV